MEFGVVVDEVHHLVRHHVFIGQALLDEIFFGVALTRFDGSGNIVAVAFPAPKVERHGQVGRAAVVPAVVLVHVFDAGQRNGNGQRGGGDGRG